jgi:glucose-1-phosphate thymidylyltransferase
MPQACILFEDQFVDRLRPINLARPTFGVTCGAYSLRQLLAETKWPLHFHVRPHLRPGVDPEGTNLAAEIAGPILYLNAALVPDLKTVAKLRDLVKAGEPFLALRDQRITAALSPNGFTPAVLLGGRDLVAHLLDQRLPVIEDEFPTFEHPFDVVWHHEKLLPHHLHHFIERGNFRALDKNVYAAEETEIASNVVLDGSEGPVVLGNRVRIRPFSYLAGPVKVGDNALIIDHAAIKHGTVLGHTVKAGGEIEVSIIEPYSNKQHHGFLGHSYVGSWVNLGAGTSNSDLKNTYGEIGIEVDGKSTPTGLQFAGCVIGDHTKTAINTSIFTGKLIGVASFVYGFVSTNVPSFTNYARSFGQVTEVSCDVAIKTQTRMARRRNVATTPVDAKLLQDLFELTRAERQLSSEQIVL